MEVIGAVSSVIALVEATSKLAKGLTHLAQRWHNAPEELHTLALATQELCMKFAYVQETVTDSPTTLVDDVARRGLTQLVSKAQSVTAELNTLHDKLNTYDTIFQKAKWAVKDAKTAKTALEKVKDVEEGLSMWINFISLYVMPSSLVYLRTLTVLQQRSQLDSAAISRDPTPPHGRFRRNKANVLNYSHHRATPRITFDFECIHVTTTGTKSCGPPIGVNSTQSVDLSGQSYGRRSFLEIEQGLAILGFAWHRAQNHERAVF